MMCIRALCVVSLYVRSAAATSSFVSVKFAVDDEQSVTPVQKVLELLVRLRAGIEEDGTREAAAYDKFACFCKEQADNKVYALGKSNEKLDKMQASMTALEGEIQELDADVVRARETITIEENITSEKQTIRQGEHESYVTVRQNLTQGIAAIERAINELQTAKGNVNDGSSLVSTQHFLSKLGLSQIAESPRGVSPEYEYRSSSVLATLQSLLGTFKAELAKVDQGERTTRHGHDMDAGARANKIKFLRQEVEEKETLSSKKAAEKNELAKLHAEETTARDADQGFLDELTDSCAKKAGVWDQRSLARADEVRAITQALEKLRTAGGLYSTNKKLVGLIATKTSIHDRQRAHLRAAMRRGRKSSTRVMLRHRANSPLTGAVSFIQNQGFVHGGSHKRHGSSMARRRALLVEHIRTGGAKLQSSALAQVNRALAQGDPFIKVRGLITDLIAQLTAEKDAEATSKSLCDTSMAAAIGERDRKQSQIETLRSSIELTNSTIFELAADLVTLDEEIAAAHKAVRELTELRTAEGKENNLTIEEANQGAQAVREAIAALENFYGPSFLEKGPDRHGDRVSDVAPETFEGNYTGKVSESKGVLGLLAIIASDFERTSQTTVQAEKDAQSAFEAQKGTLQTDISDRNLLKTTKEGQKAEKNAELTQHQDDLLDAVKLHADALEELEKWKASCVDASESYEERRLRREKEIEGLKEAMEILNNWES
jgi:hypothetical protein